MPTDFRSNARTSVPLYMFLSPRYPHAACVHIFRTRDALVRTPRPRAMHVHDPRSVPVKVVDIVICYHCATPPGRHYAVPTRRGRVCADGFSADPSVLTAARTDYLSNRRFMRWRRRPGAEKRAVTAGLMTDEPRVGRNDGARESADSLPPQVSALSREARENRMFRNDWR